MNFEELVESKKSIGSMSKEELFTYCNGLLDEIYDFENETKILNRKLDDIETFCKSFDPGKLTDHEKVMLDSIMLIANGTIKVVK